MFASHLFSRIAINALGGGVPTDDYAITSFTYDPLFGRLHDRGQEVGRLLDLFTFGDVDARAGKADELSFFCKARNAVIQQPSIFSVRALQAVFDTEAPASLQRRRVSFQTTLQIVRVNVISPAVPLLLLHRPSGELDPLLIDEGAQSVGIRQPKHNGGGVGHRAKTVFGLAQCLLG